MKAVYDLIATGMVPDFAIRFGIKQMLAQKLQELKPKDGQNAKDTIRAFVKELKQCPIALHTDTANKQHYELPAEFFQTVLGHRLKYSSGYWHQLENNSLSAEELNKAEDAMLALYLERAQIKDGQNLLDLGCGWGSFSLYAAAKFPASKFTALSNSAVQREFIEKRAKELKIKNLTVITGNIAEVELPEFKSKFDRIVSIEMFEHMKNYELLMRKVALWLKPGGKLFVHIFTHKDYAYHYENKDGNDWLTENFFTGGTMPSDDLLLHFQDDLKIESQWRVDGRHYRNTANAWLKKMDANQTSLESLFKITYGDNSYKQWWNYWRLFFIACAELWGYENGSEWIVSHYLFSSKT
ncbi:MAG: class I SAM-dependent methyltransferase [Cyanobacteria bacterium TGS_CYA1]|nr:class I SAM-dependent methyltransferase [Cyanobacteria bacterium TGS_CYA1]